jgi:hypothetical protein
MSKTECGCKWNLYYLQYNQASGDANSSKLKVVASDEDTRDDTEQRANSSEVLEGSDLRTT